MTAATPPAQADATNPEASPAAENPGNPLDAQGTFLAPNAKLDDGTPIYLHVTEADMPWRVAIGYPPEPPRDASRSRAREVAIESMQMWERAIQPRVPWFRLEFVEKDRSAAVQVEWKRRVTGPFAGFGGIREEVVDGRARIGGAMEISTRPDLYSALTIDELRYLVSHEFGHVLGLMHCHACDSAMNYSWHTRDRIFVTETDVRTFVALLAVPNRSPHGATLRAAD